MFSTSRVWLVSALVVALAAALYIVSMGAMTSGPGGDPPPFDAGASARPDPRQSGTWSGMKMLPDPSNLAVGFRLTDEPCSMELVVQEDGALLVKSTLWAGLTTEFTELHLMAPSIDFYQGDLPQGRLAVLQYARTRPDRPAVPVSLTYTSYDEHGDPNYGISGTGDMISECGFRL